MERADWIAYIAAQYGAEAEYPWERYPDYAVFRHRSNRKWFALVMDVPAEKLGLSGGGNLPVMNLKCGPALTGSLPLERGFFPAYHMSKTQWISAALDGSADEAQIKWLLGLSYDATKPKKKAPKGRAGKSK